MWGRVGAGTPTRANEQDTTLLYYIIKVLLTPIFFVVWRIRVKGRKNVPRHGPGVIASNHVSFMESMFVPATLRRRVTYVAKAEYFESWRTRWFFAGSGQIPLERTGGSASEAAIAAAESVLDKGHLFGIYPEGTRSPDGRLYRGKTGVARIALQTGAPLIPVGVIGTDKVLPAGKKFPRLGKRVEIIFGEPIDVDKYRRWPDEYRAARALTDELMYEIRELTGQVYVDEYAKKPGKRRLDEDAETGESSGNQSASAA